MFNTPLAVLDRIDVFIAWCWNAIISGIHTDRDRYDWLFISLSINFYPMIKKKKKKLFKSRMYVPQIHKIIHIF